MKKFLILSTALLLIVSCSPSITTIKEIDDHFLYDLGSENNRIAADLQETVFENGLDTLSYEYYINYLDKNSTPSAKGLVCMIRKADGKYFETNEHSFFLVLYYKCNGQIIGDYSETAFVDTVITIDGENDILSFRNLVKKMNVE